MDEAETGKAALSAMGGKVAPGKRVALVLMASRLPDMDGVELARAIKRDRRLAE